MNEITIALFINNFSNTVLHDKEFLSYQNDVKLAVVCYCNKLLFENYNYSLSPQRNSYFIFTITKDKFDALKEQLFLIQKYYNTEIKFINGNLETLTNDN